jgi:dipeptidyl aminopeptidase/acylaminoacyl peptidase
MKKQFVFLIAILLLGISCTENSTAKNSAEHHATQAIAEDTLIIPVPMYAFNHDTTLTLSYNNNSVNLLVRFPATEQIRGEILLLHGYNLPTDDWCTKMSFCQKALNLGYVIIMPDFSKTTYHWETYPETNQMLLKYPTRQWMYNHFMEALKLHGFFKSNNVFVAGISTGARGAALFALEMPSLFVACAALSGDFDQTKLQPGEWINTNYYGALEKHKDRWQGRDNIFNRANEYKVPTYLGHGKLDKVCPVFHSEEFYAELKKQQPSLDVVLSTPNAAHDYPFWESQTDAVLEFFEKHRRE